ncbi:hypothetical protein FHS57_000299 [Runella defluvii]|uniref:Uncharacterized protein n=1 Tax=Runella defluvii TaxID=370973 RepID=A0A7W5ZFD4_9BACT|nr:hypothetical protein [Runella defluvii]MBB3836317.1 hypothetical protein [Runella defluvii]
MGKRIIDAADVDKSAQKQIELSDLLRRTLIKRLCNSRYERINPLSTGSDGLLIRLTSMNDRVRISRTTHSLNRGRSLGNHEFGITTAALNELFALTDVSLEINVCEQNGEKFIIIEGKDQPCGDDGHGGDGVKVKIPTV